MTTTRFKPARVALAVVSGLAIGLVLVRTFTPRTAEMGEGEALPATAAPVRRAAAPPAASGDGGIARVSHELLADRIPEYPRAGKRVRIGDRLDTNGVPMVMASFETSDSYAKVLEWYAHYFEERGFPWQGVDESLKQAGLPALSATDVIGGLQLSVIAFPHAGGASVIVAAADMDTYYERADTNVPDDGELPSYPGAKPMVMRTSDGPRDAVMVTFATPDGVKAVQDFYRDRLGKRGFKELPVERPDKSRLEQLEFIGDGRSWRLFLASSERGTAVAAQGGWAGRP